MDIYIKFRGKMAKNSKNLQRVQNMLDGNYSSKIQVGVGDQEVNPIRKVGDKWTDSDGIEWEQKKGYYSKVSKIERGIFSKQCKDCNRNCSLEKRHKDTYNRMERCFYCQIDFEAMLKTKGIWRHWVRLQQLRTLDVMEKEAEQLVYEMHEENQKKIFDMSVSNAISNANLEMTIKKNTK